MDGGPTDPPLDPAAADEADANDSSAGSKLSDDVDPGHPAPGPVAESSTESIGTQAARGVLWMTAQNWLARAGGLVTIAILTRLLAPEDFGLLAVASTLLTLTYVLSDLGLSTYLVQATKIDQASLSTAFWVSLMGGVVMSAGIYFGAPFIAALVHVPSSVPILQSMTVIVLFISASSVPLSLMRRQMQFRLLAFQFSIGAVLAQIAAIVAALAGLGVWALVLQLLVGQVVASITQWFSAKWRPALLFSRQEFGVMVRYGINIVGSGLVTVGRGWVETGIIAAGLGIRELGYLSIAQRLIQTANDLSGSALLPVSTAAFAKVNSSKERLQAAHAKATAVSQTIVTPLMVLIVVSASVLVPFLFGQEWTVSAPLTQPLAIAAVLSFGTVLDRGLLDGVGRPGRWLAFTSVISTLSVVLIFFGVSNGVLLVTFIYVFVAAVELVGRWFLVGHFLEATAWSTARPFVMVVPAACVSAAGGLGCMWLLQSLNPFLLLAVTGVVVLALHLVVTRLVTPTTWREIVALIPGRTRRA
jgi:O-antigen/teichoic acid export membrane protein